MADSAFDYTAEITAISLDPNRLQVLYTPVDSSDPNRQPTYRSIGIATNQYNDSDIQVLIKQNAGLIGAKWSAAVVAAVENPSFDDSDFLGDTYSFRYKPVVIGSYPPPFDDTRFTVVSTDSETADAIVRNYFLDSLPAETVAAVQGSIEVTKLVLELELLRTGHLDSAQIVYGVGDNISASWDGSAAAGFDFGTHKIASFGVKNIERINTGVYRVVPLVPFSDTNYTISTGVGDQDYSGAGASPRQLTVTSRAVDSFQVVCERTDDAVNEDNTYMSFVVAKHGGNDSNEILWRHKTSFLGFDSCLQPLKDDVLGMNDSDFAAFLRTANDATNARGEGY